MRNIRPLPILASLVCSSSLLAAPVSLIYNDPVGDDTGNGSYTYPAAVQKGSADICKIGVEVTDENVAITVGVKAFTENTRVAIVLFDEAAYADPEIEWAIGGTELKLPFWNNRGTAFVLGLPEDQSKLFDYNVTKSIPVDAPTPDNAIFVNGGPAAWIGADGALSQDPTNIFRLEPTAVKDENCQTLRYEFPKSLVTPYLAALADDTSAIYATAYSFLVVEGGNNEFGAFEVSATEGASDSWEDTDAFDIAFTGQEVVQDKILTVEGEGEAAVIKLRELDSGIGKVR